MSTANAVKIQLQAASLRRKVRKMRRRRGLSSDLKKPIERCRKISPGAADGLGRVLYPKLDRDAAVLKNVPTRQLVEELAGREGVDRFWAEPYEELPLSVSGPAIVLVIID